MINKKSKIFVAGHKGMVGSAIIKKIKKKGFSKIIFAEKKKLNLLDQDKVFKFLKKKKPDLVIIAAARELEEYKLTLILSRYLFMKIYKFKII